MASALLDGEAFENGLKGVGPGAEFRYRCIYDPVPADGRRDSAGEPCGGKRLLVVAGPEGSGKSSLIVSLGLDSAEPRILNPDNYARGLSGIEDSVIRGRVASDACRVLRETLLEKGVPFGIETRGSVDDILFLRRARDAGYTIELLFVATCDPEINVSRAASRAESRGMPRDLVLVSYSSAMLGLRELIGLSDRAEVVDNSGDAPVRIFSKSGGSAVLVEGVGWLDAAFLRRSLSSPTRSSIRPWTSAPCRASTRAC